MIRENRKQTPQILDSLFNGICVYNYQPLENRSQNDLQKSKLSIKEVQKTI